MALQKPPYSVIGSVQLKEWLRGVYDYLTFTISTHNQLTGIQGGNSTERYHLTNGQLLDLTNGGDSTAHYHPSDRDSANFTGTNWTDLTDAGATTLHKHDLVNMDSYSTGTWTPTFTSLTVVLGGGSVTYTGRYTKIGRMVFFQVRVIPSGGATTASTAGTTYCDMGLAAAQNGCNRCMNEVTRVSNGNQIVDASTDRIYAPGWTATTDSMVITGEYEV